MTMRKKRKFKSIISTFLCLALLGGAVFGVTKLLKNDTDTVEIKSSAFAVGALDEDGKYVENKQTLYTKEMFLCDGLTVELDKDCKSTYQIFYYDEDGEFIEASEVLTEDFEEDIVDGAVNARIMITPEIPEDKTAEDFKISDRIYYMDSSNARYLKQLFPKETKYEAFLPRNVADPWYTGDFTQTWADICEGCENIIQKLKEQAL